MKYLLATIFSWITLAASAQQFSMEAVHDGTVMLVEGDTAKGKIKYDFNKDFIQFVLPNSAEQFIFSAQKILSFEIIDELTNEYRQFYSLPYDIKSNNYKTPVLFEIVASGQLSLLLREKIEYATNRYSGYGRAYNILQTVYYFYFLNENGDIQLFSGKKRDLKRVMGDHYNEISKFIKFNRLKLDTKRDLAKIVNYYNSLLQQNN